MRGLCLFCHYLASHDVLTLQAVRLIQFKSATQADLVLYFSRIIARRYNQYQIIPVVVVVSFQLWDLSQISTCRTRYAIDLKRDQVMISISMILTNINNLFIIQVWPTILTCNVMMSPITYPAIVMRCHHLSDVGQIPRRVLGKKETINAIQPIGDWLVEGNL